VSHRNGSGSEVTIFCALLHPLVSEFLCLHAKNHLWVET